MGGSPCTHWSIAQTKNRETEPSGLGWELFKNYLVAKEKYKPGYFLYENNKSMAPAIREQITKELGVEPILINSAKVSAQNRQRLYWTNIPGVEQPEDRGILLRDVLESGVTWNEKAYTLDAHYYKTTGVFNPKKQRSYSRLMAAEQVELKDLSDKEMEYMVREVKDGRNHFDFDYFHDGGSEKSSCVTANTHKGVPYNVLAEPVNVTADGKAQCLRATYYKDGIRNMVGNTVDRKTCVAEPVRIGTIENDSANKNFDSQQYRVYSPDGKSVTICGQGGGVGAKTGLYAVPCGAARRGGHERNQCWEIRSDEKSNAVIGGHQSRLVCESWDGKTHPVYEVKDGLITIKDKQYPIKLADGYYIIRKLTVLECMRLQTVPETYTFPVSPTQAYKMLGNGWTVDVIAHILSYAPGIAENPIEVLSMYDGMSCGHIALDKLGANATRYYATEIDKYAIKTTMENYPNTIQLGDAFQVREDGWALPTGGLII